MSGAYYNEIDPFAAAWLRELITAGWIADGEVDERSIELVRPDDLRGFRQCHFFAGIGGWSYALRLAGWSDDRECWTGSCPCQPFSSAGTQAGGHDPRDLWPAWYQLIRECRPVCVFGEQVEAAIAHGWLDRLCDDMEREGYAVGACGLPAASVGAFHIRQRLWFVADAGRERRDGQRLRLQQREPRPDRAEIGRGGEVDDMANAMSAGRAEGRAGARYRPATGRGGIGGVVNTESEQVGVSGRARQPRTAGGMADTDKPLAGHGELQRSGRLVQSAEDAPTGFWADADWIGCADGKARPVEPGTFPLVAGVSGGVVPIGDPSESYAKSTAEARVGRLRGYGNAIVPPLAAEFIGAYMSIVDERAAARV